MRAVSGAMFDYLWDIVDHNGTTLKQDGERSAPSMACGLLVRRSRCGGRLRSSWLRRMRAWSRSCLPTRRGGPVMIDRGAIVHAFSRLEGPCYVGPESWIVGAKLRANSTIGPCCRIGGEVEASIVQGYSNKYHEGFLGHSYVGEWVNLAAATQTSDLRNDYDNVRVTINGKRLSTGHNKVGSYFGDHTKTGLAALLNTGSAHRRVRRRPAQRQPGAAGRSPRSAWRMKGNCKKSGICANSLPPPTASCSGEAKP